MKATPKLRKKVPSRPAIDALLTAYVDDRLTCRRCKATWTAHAPTCSAPGEAHDWVRERTPQSTRAYNKLYLATVGANVDGPLVRWAWRNCEGSAGSKANAQEIAQEILAGVVNMTPDVLKTYKSNLFYRTKRAAQMLRRSRQPEAFGLTDEGEDEVATTRARRIERATFEGAGVHTPESAAMLAQAARRAGIETSIPLTTSGWAAARVGDGDEVAGLQPLARDVLRALVALAHEGEEPTTRSIMRRARCDSDGGVRRYLLDLRRAGWIDDQRCVVRTVDGEAVPPNPLHPPQKPTHGLPPAQVRMLSAYVALVRETGRAPSHEAILARVERETAKRYADAGRPLKGLAKAGYIDAETGAVLRTLDGATVPTLNLEPIAEVVELHAAKPHAVEPETKQATPKAVVLRAVESKVTGPIEFVLPTLSPEEVERRERMERLRASLVTEDRRGVRVRNLFYFDPLRRPTMQSAPELGDHPAAVRTRGPVASRGADVPPSWMIAEVDQAAEYERDNRPRVFGSAWAPLPLGLRGPGADSGVPLAGTPSGLPPPSPMPLPVRTAFFAHGMSMDTWWESHERAMAERALSVARDVELDPDLSPGEELRFSDEGERCPAKKARRRSRPRRGDGDL